MSGFERDAKGCVFGIGLSRTGTRSLAAGLEMLGFPCVHYPDPALMLCGAYAEALGPCRAATDITVTTFYKELDAAYPGSRFILTVRELDAWLGSIGAHTRRIMRDTPEELEPDHPKGVVSQM